LIRTDFPRASLHGRTEALGERKAHPLPEETGGAFSFDGGAIGRWLASADRGAIRVRILLAPGLQIEKS
jgi:hypothetical protein